ncbi:hypothetical protein N7540_010610 [Penicillium herquei]|nr:hypothetical protein N7540_010610 [Penicillium herquei]
MAPRDQSQVHVPLRTSSRNLRSDAMNQEDATFVDRRTSKAQRILGTDLPIHNQAQMESQKHSKSRRSSLRTPDNNSTRQSTGFVPFPNAIPSDRMIPPQNLRVRASSPLLGHEYLSHDPTPPLPKPSKRIHQSGSSSTLFSYFTSKESKSDSPQGLQPRVSNKLGIDPHVTFKQSQSPPKESKRKMRPPRIDLSILFPKPRNQAPPLLSPQRMTSSPSPVSTVVSDYPTQTRDRTSKSSKTSTSTARRFGDPLPVRTSMVHSEAPKPHMDRSDLLSIPESKDSDFLDRPFERTVGTSEIDLALDRYAARRSVLSHSSMYTASREQLQTDQRRPSETSSNTRRGQSPANPQRQSRDVYLSPKSKSQPASQITSPPEQTWRQKDRRSSQGTKGSVTKKSSKSTLQNKDLQNTSVLCLSSSDDETEDEKPTPTDIRLPNKKFRDSVATYDEFDAEIYTASTAHAATAQMLRKVDRTSSIGSSSRGSQKMPQRQLSRQHVSNPSMSSTSKSSTTTRRTTQSRRSSGVPIISEPDILEQLPQPPRRTPRELKELKEMNRRSRVIAVTRQEQDLLEAMRQRKGKITPSIFNYNTATEPDRNSVLSVPSRDSFCGSDTSFLRLSAAFPPFPQRSDQGALHKHKSGSPSQSSSSDSEQKTGDSGYSESLPSPSTSGASPLTPTLPIHRFSPLPSPKPPPRGPPPAIPEDQKQHTRRRTDSSEAIMLNDEPPRKHDLPLWSFDFDWNHDRTSMAAVH